MSEQTNQLGFYKCRPAMNGVPGFIAWAALEPLSDVGPCEEPAEPVWFQFGKTESETIEKLKSEIETESNIKTWIRQIA